MSKKSLAIPGLVLGLALGAEAQTAGSKVGVVHFQNALAATKDGQKAAGELQAKFNPKKAELDKKQSGIQQLQDQLRKGSATMSEEAKQNLMRQIDSQTKELNRSMEDAQAELDQEQNRIYQELGPRLYAVINKYAKDNGYTVVLDVSNPQTPIVFVADAADITKDVIDLYDKAAPAATSAAPGTPPAPPVTGGAARTTPPAVNPPAAKKK